MRAPQVERGILPPGSRCSKPPDERTPNAIRLALFAEKVVPQIIDEPRMISLRYAREPVPSIAVSSAILRRVALLDAARRAAKFVE
jgi:hypothetical protein